MTIFETKNGPDFVYNIGAVKGAKHKEEPYVHIIGGIPCEIRHNNTVTYRG